MDKAVSLSIDIEEDVQGNFELFAKLYRYGHFAEARTWFNDCFGASSWKESFPLAAELAKCLLEQGDFQALADLTSEAQVLFRGSEASLMGLLQVLADIEGLRAEGGDEQDSVEVTTHRFLTSEMQAAKILSEQAPFRNEDPLALQDKVEDGTLFDLHTQLMSTSLRIAQALKELSVGLVSELKHPIVHLTGKDESPWSAYRRHFSLALAKRDFASAQELLNPLLSLLDSAQAKQIFQEFTTAVYSWSKGLKIYLDDKTSGNPTSDYILAMESTWLATAAATAQYCQHLSAEVANDASIFPFRKQRRIKEIWTWIHQLRQVLMQLELCNASVVDSRPGLLYNLQILITKRLEGQQHATTDEDDILASARQQEDRVLERILEAQKGSTSTIASRPHSSKGFLLDLFLPMTSGGGLEGELRPTVSTVSDLLWQFCLFTLQVTTVTGLIPMIVIYPGFIAIPVCVFAIFVLSKVSSWRQGPATTASSKAGPFFPRWRDERWIFLSGTFTTASHFQSNVDAISEACGRPVFGIQGRRRGWLADFLLDCASQRLGITSRQTDLAYHHLKAMATDVNVYHIVLIAHGAGAIAASQILNKLFLQLGPEFCGKIQVFTFGSMAKTMYNPDLTRPLRTISQGAGIDNIAAIQPRRAFKTVEHYCNSDDPIARMGILKGFQQPGDQPHGAVFLFDGASGHFFIQHYLNHLLYLKEVDASGSVSSRELSPETTVPRSTDKSSGATSTLERDELLYVFSSTPAGGRGQGTSKDKRPSEHVEHKTIGSASKLLAHMNSDTSEPRHEPAGGSKWRENQPTLRSDSSARRSSLLEPD